jgi:hypothetical protein
VRGERRGARNVSASRYASAEVEQRKLNEMIGAELGLRYAGSPIIAGSTATSPSRTASRRAIHC